MDRLWWMDGCGVAVAVADGHGRQCENIIMMTTTTKNEMCSLGRKFSARAENNEMNIIIYVRFVRASVAMLNGTRKTSSKQWFFDNRKKMYVRCAYAEETLDDTGKHEWIKKKHFFLLFNRKYIKTNKYTKTIIMWSYNI